MQYRVLQIYEKPFNIRGLKFVMRGSRVRVTQAAPLQFAFKNKYLYASLSSPDCARYSRTCGSSKHLHHGPREHFGRSMWVQHRRDSLAAYFAATSCRCIFDAVEGLSSTLGRLSVNPAMMYRLRRRIGVQILLHLPPVRRVHQVRMLGRHVSRDRVDRHRVRCLRRRW